jgi:hypothetical protein
MNKAAFHFLLGSRKKGFFLPGRSISGEGDRLDMLPSLLTQPVVEERTWWEAEMDVGTANVALL